MRASGHSVGLALFVFILVNRRCFALLKPSIPGATSTWPLLARLPLRLVGRLPRSSIKTIVALKKQSTESMRCCLLKKTVCVRSLL
ncbi:MAG TPA: hypothetical protein VN426_00240 [Syntrophomonadaceae bacterium]|nr:hypothetical protein [Syntrophomonadaceae bacterium]